MVTASIALTDREMMLLCAVRHERAGRDIAIAYAMVTGRRIAYGTLYVMLGRLVDRGLIQSRESADDDGAVLWFLVTELGAAILARMDNCFGLPVTHP